MKSVGETMAIGRTFKESLQKGLRGLEIGRSGFIGDGAVKPLTDEPESEKEKKALLKAMRRPTPGRRVCF